MKVYGIKNCGTVKKAIDWLSSHDKSYEFHDYKKEGVSEEKLQEWVQQAGVENLINRKGTTWRKLDDEQKEKIQDEQEAIKIMALQPSIIKRPLIEHEGKVVSIGFNEQEYSSHFR